MRKGTTSRELAVRRWGSGRHRQFARACGVLAVLVLAGQMSTVFAAPRPTHKLFTLAYDRAPAACHYLLNLYNHDISRKGYVDPRAHRVFRAIHWQKVTGPIPEHDQLTAAELTFEKAYFDLTNAGVPQWVIKVRTLMGNTSADEQLLIMRAPPGDELQLLRQVTGKAGTTYARPLYYGDLSFYVLTKVPKTRIAPHLWQHPVMSTLTALYPLRYQGKTYVSMSNFAWHGRILPGDWIVIGKASPRGPFRKVCYFKPNPVSRTRSK